MVKQWIQFDTLYVEEVLPLPATQAYNTTRCLHPNNFIQQIETVGILTRHPLSLFMFAPVRWITAPIQGDIGTFFASPVVALCYRTNTRAAPLSCCTYAVALPSSDARANRRLLAGQLLGGHLVGHCVIGQMRSPRSSTKSDGSGRSGTASRPVGGCPPAPAALWHATC